MPATHRSHFPLFMDMSARAREREETARREKASCAVETVLPPGVFITMMPFFVAAARSMLSTPTPGGGGGGVGIKGKDG